jgi:hypothetical protein
MDQSGEKIVWTVELLDSKGTVEKLGCADEESEWEQEKRLAAEGKWLVDSNKCSLVPINIE